MIHQTFEYANGTQFQMRVRKQYALKKYEYANSTLIQKGIPPLWEQERFSSDFRGGL